MNAHTPGPWRLNQSRHYDEIIGPKNEFIGYTGAWRNEEKSEMHANTRLMIAAPDLLAALKLCAGVVAGETMHKRGLVEALEAARTAIKKAEGV